MIENFEFCYVLFLILNFFWSSSCLCDSVFLQIIFLRIWKQKNDSQNLKSSKFNSLTMAALKNVKTLLAIKRTHCFF